MLSGALSSLRRSWRPPPVPLIFSSPSLGYYGLPSGALAPFSSCSPGSERLPGRSADLRLGRKAEARVPGRASRHDIWQLVIKLPSGLSGNSSSVWCNRPIAWVVSWFKYRRVRAICWTRACLSPATGVFRRHSLNQGNRSYLNRVGTCSARCLSGLFAEASGSQSAQPDRAPRVRTSGGAPVPALAQVRLGSARLRRGYVLVQVEQIGRVVAVLQCPQPVELLYSVGSPHPLRRSRPCR